MLRSIQWILREPSHVEQNLKSRLFPTLADSSCILWMGKLRFAPRTETMVDTIRLVGIFTLGSHQKPLG